MTDWRTATSFCSLGCLRVLYLVLVRQLMVTCGVDEIRRRAAED
jgi:hypothetical protein